MSARYLVALFAVIGAVLATAGLQSISSYFPGFPLLFCAAIFSAWFGGLGPGLLAAAVSSAVIALNLIPASSPANTMATEFPRLLLFAPAVFFVSWISGRQKQAEELLQRARDELEEKVQSRTVELRRANDELQAEMAERKVAEEALQTMEGELAHVSRLTMMGELTASIAHEVNQPLGAIMNYASACRRLLPVNLENRAQIDQALAGIAGDADRASSVIARIRALSRKKPTERIRSEVKSLVDDVVAIARYKLVARGIAARVELALDLPPLRIDRVQIQQVLLNLIINGLEAMETVPADRRVIEIIGRSGRCDEKPAVILSVRDHGAGIDPMDQSRLFEAFYSTKSEGIGLGLAISRSIVESHGGRLCLIPTEGGGATFQISLPAEEPANP